MKIAIAGASGRMGRMLIETVLNTEGVTLTGALDIPGAAALGQDAAMFLGRETGVKISDDIEAVLGASDCLIDFTRPEGTLAHLAVAKRLGKKIVVGTTGFDTAGKQALEDAAKSIGVVFASNFSVGVNATFKLLEVAAKLLSTGYDIEVIEAHHRHKVDAPSGTALTMGEVIAKAVGRNLDDCAVYAREGHTGPRDPKSIGFATIRGGDIVGDHTVMFAGIGERIEISHKSSSRQSYADGAVRAARFLADKPNGLFDMQDVLGLK
ncbi:MULTISPECIES: 4-hydroxy-tetrahydrodipicolinate reductase [unclassified Cupriavidus]|uniref:4-hydroxy-tetrahydrodipicolinate reductase n=1 Tax=unclassified Cupriavidus TaxID=2640874 RepID=UPI001365204F|nr:4-hydroxy-tetrahydrodipicolinate reductase [Cupriavidus sp. SW-Y-13]MWL88416.1 4-hydroxy-tetrahydrodipicolinate reductase [Cupriavidus sp. SW-Y-13]